MKRNSFAFILVLVLLNALPSSDSFAEVPQKINYQGRLLTSTGEPLEGIITINFTLFGSLTGGTALWSESQDIGLDNGYFNVILGSITAFPQSLFDNPLYIEISIGGETLSPRTPLASAAYALKAAKVEAIDAGAVTTDAIAPGAVTSDRIATSAVITSRIAPSAVTSDRIAPDTIQSDDIATNAVNSAEIAPGAVTADDIAAGAVESDKIASGAVDFAAIAAHAVSDSWYATHPSFTVYEGNTIDILTLAVDLAHDGTVLVMAKGTTAGAHLTYGRVTYTISADGSPLDWTDNAIFGDSAYTQYYSAALLGRTSLTAGSHTIKLTVAGIDIDDSETVTINECRLTVIALYK